MRKRLWGVCIAIALLVVPVRAGWAAKKKKKGGAKKPTPTKTTDRPADGAAADEDVDPRPLYDSAVPFNEVLDGVELLLEPVCDAGLPPAALETCKETLPARVEKSREALIGAVIRLDPVFVRRVAYVAKHGRYMYEIGKGGVLRARGLILGLDVVVDTSEALSEWKEGEPLAAPDGKTEVTLGDLGLKSFYGASDSFESEEVAAKSWEGTFDRGNGAAVAKILRVENLTVECGKKKCGEFPLVVVEPVSWALSLSSETALLDGKAVPAFGPFASGASDVEEDGPAKTSVSPKGGKTGGGGVSDEIDSMLGDIDPSGAGGTAPVAGTEPLKPSDITRVMNDRKYTLRKCSSFGKGLLMFRFEIRVDGTVGSLGLKSGSKHKGKPVAKCVAKIIKETRFPAHKGPAKKITYPVKVP